LESNKMNISLTKTVRSKLCLLGAFALAAGLSSPSGAQITSPTIPGGGDPVQRGVGEALRSGTQGGTIGDSLRRGLGEAAQSAIETPGQTMQRDQQLRMQPQFDVQQRGQFAQPQPGAGTLYQDEQGRSYYLDDRGSRVFTQPQGYTQQPRMIQPGVTRQPGITGQAGASAGMQASTAQGPSLGVSIEPVDQGVRVLDVRGGSAAEQAGLRRGDVIRSVNGQPVVSVQSLVQRVNESAGGEMEIEVMRDGREEQVVAMIREADPAYRMARPAIDDTAQSGMSEQIAVLQSKLAKLQDEVVALRQVVSELRVPRDDVELLNNTAPTPLDTSPAEPVDDAAGSAIDRE
jgi:hypothetical protein